MNRAKGWMPIVGYTTVNYRSLYMSYCKLLSMSPEINSSHSNMAVPLANFPLALTHKTAPGLAKYGIMQPYTGPAVRDRLRTHNNPLWPYHTSPNQGSIRIQGFTELLCNDYFSGVRIKWKSTHLWDPATLKMFGLPFIGSNNHHDKFQRPKIRDAINEEAEKIGAKTLELHVKRSKRPLVLQ